MARTDYGAILSTVIKDTSDAVREVNGTSSLIAPNQWGTAIRTMHSDSDYDNVMAQLIEETATGDIASFSDGANNIPCPSVLCTINPVQDLHGQDYPYPSGGGKNKYNISALSKLIRNGTESTGGISVSNDVVTVSYSYGQQGTYALSQVLYNVGTTITVSADFLISGTNSAQTVEMNVMNNTADTSVTVTTGQQIALSGKNVWEHKSATFTLNSNADNGINIVLMPRNTGNTLQIKNLQVELGSTATPYAPYENICPITGHTELNLVHTGKNLFSPEKAVADSDNADTYISGDWLYFRTGGSPMSYYINSDKQLTISGTFKNETSTNNILRVRARYTDGTVSDMIYATLTDTNEHQLSGSSISGKVIQRVYVAYTNSAVCMCKNVQLEIGSSATAYEPYTGSTTTTDLGTTVYGGTLDVVSGVLTLTHEIKICKWADGISSADLGSYIRKRFPFSSSNYGKHPPTSLDYIMCDKAPYLYNFNSDTLHFYYNSNEVLLFMPEDTDGETLISVTFELATPTTIQLTPQEVKSLLGSNNIYHDCNGQVAVTYKANGQLYVEQHT